MAAPFRGLGSDAARPPARDSLGGVTMRNLRKLAKRLVPPALFDLYLHFRHGVHLGPNWEGIYPHMRDVPVRGPGFAAPDWHTVLERALRNVLADEVRAGEAPRGVVRHHQLLPLVLAPMLAAQGNVRVLDFGGGVGVDYALLRRCLAGGGRVDYQVVEGEAVVAAGRRLFFGDEGIRFLTSLPPPEPQFDVVYACSSLQYIEDYAGLIRALCGFGARYLLLANHPIGDVPTYAAGQLNLPGSVIAYWFFNLNEIVSLVEACGYRLIFKAATEDGHDQSAYPEGHRIGHCSHLLFTRTPGPVRA